MFRCQTYEGGLGGEPGNEAHGGYTYCGLAALVLIKKTDAINLERLIVICVYSDLIMPLLIFFAALGQSSSDVIRRRVSRKNK